MTVRRAEFSDLPRIEKIYALAREEMRRRGNPTQWGKDRPGRERILKDIEDGTGYVLEEDGEIVGVFAFLPGEDPTYRTIAGQWLGTGEYGALHRVASSGRRRGILRECLNFCEARTPDLRVDTHEKNAVMRHLLEKFGYTECGVIIAADGTPRIAYEKIVKEE